MNLPVAALIGGGALMLHFLPRRAPALGVVVGLSLLGFAGYMASTFERGSFQTEGSPAGTILFVVYLAVGLLAIVAGLYLVAACTHRLLAGPEAASPAKRATPTAALPPDLSACRIWLTPEACAAGALAEARDLHSRSRRTVVVAQDPRYEQLLAALPSDATVPVIAARDFHVQEVRRIAGDASALDVLTLGLIRDTGNETLVLGLVNRASQATNLIRHLSLDDLERGGLHVGRARTAASALQLRAHAPLDHPMVLDAIIRAEGAADRR